MLLKYLKLYTSYKYELLKCHTSGINLVDYPCKKEINISAPCFRGFFQNLPNDAITDSIFHIKVYTTLDFNRKENANNYTFITEEELIWYLDYLKTIVPFEYELIRSEETNPSKCYYGLVTVKITSTSKTHFENKWIVSSVRSVYEFPQSWALKEAIELKKLGFFEDDDNIVNAMNAIISCAYFNLSEQYVPCISESGSPIRMSTQEVSDNIQKLKLNKSSRLNQIYVTSPHSLSFKKFLSSIITQFNTYIKDCVETLSDEELFNPELLKTRYKLFYKKTYK